MKLKIDFREKSRGSAVTILNGQEALIRRLRADAELGGAKLGAAGADPLFTLLEQHDEMAWMHRAVPQENNQVQMNGVIKILARRLK